MFQILKFSSLNFQVIINSISHLHSSYYILETSLHANKTFQLQLGGISPYTFTYSQKSIHIIPPLEGDDNHLHPMMGSLPSLSLIGKLCYQKSEN